MKSSEVTQNISQKQPSRSVLRKRFSENRQQIYSCFSTVLKLPIGMDVIRTPFLKNTSRGLLLISEDILQNENYTLNIDAIPFDSQKNVT